MKMVTHHKISAFPFCVPRLLVCLFIYACKRIFFPLIHFFFLVERANIFGVAIL